LVSPILPLTLTGATVRKRGKLIIGPVDLTLGAEGVTILMGPNGAGKTTLLRLIHGLDRLRAGKAEWRIPEAEARKRQSFIFQRPILLRRSVLDNIAYPLRLRGYRPARARAEAEDWGARCGLAEMLDRPAHVLSGGEQQKLALARAMVTRPELLLLDEPTSHLDGRSTREFEQLLRETIATGTRVMMATHDMGQARRLATEVVFLYQGGVLEHMAADDFFAGAGDPKAQAFLKGDII
jgi:tungstate transport system ATP-binding protein